MKKIITLSVALTLMLSMHAQTIEGDALIPIVGSKVDAPNTAAFLSAYSVKHKADVKYSSYESGIDMTASHDTLVSMTLYQNNSLYGKYTHKLPKGLSFDMNCDQAVAKLGKAATAYTNKKYCELRFGAYILSCWFENGTLNSVSIALK